MRQAEVESLAAHEDAAFADDAVVSADDETAASDTLPPCAKPRYVQRNVVALNTCHC